MVGVVVSMFFFCCFCCLCFQAEDGIRYLVRSRGLGDVYKRQPKRYVAATVLFLAAIPIYIASLIGWSWWLFILVPMAGAFTGAVHSIMVVLSQRIIPGGMALASGLALGFIFSSGALGLLFTGHLAEVYGFPFVLTMTTGMVILASPLALLLKEPVVNPSALSLINISEPTRPY